MRLFKTVIKEYLTRLFIVRNENNVSIGNNSYLIHCKVVGRGKIVIGNNLYLKNCTFTFEEGDNYVEILDDAKLIGVGFVLRHGGDNIIQIGRGTTTGGDVTLEASEGSKVVVGEDCMFSHHIRVYTTDGHSILDEAGQRINQARDVLIGNHVWIGFRAMVLKGSVIPEGSIVGANSTYSGSLNIESNSIYAGQPAKIVKRNICWVRKLIK